MDAERAQRKVGRLSKAEPFRSFPIGELAVQPDVLAVELLRRAKLKGYTGSKSALYALVKELRPKRPRPVVRFEGLPGEFSQHDFGHVDVQFLDGRKQRVHFFASRLKYSRWVQVKLVDNEQVEALVRAMVEHFAAWGGLPLLAVFDRPKTIALAWTKDDTVTEWNPDVRRSHARPRRGRRAVLAAQSTAEGRSRESRRLGQPRTFSRPNRRERPDRPRCRGRWDRRGHRGRWA
jgi:hypothetical protein